MWDAQRDAIQRARWLNDFVGSSLGPNGLAKILMKSSDDFTITSDGVLMLEAEFLSSPTDKILIEMAESLRNISGDGSKSAVILACELLSRAESLLDSGVHPNSIIKGFNDSADKAIQILQCLGQPLGVSNDESLRKVVEVILSPRFPAKEDLPALSSAIVEAVRAVSTTNPSSKPFFNDRDVTVKGIVGGALADTKVVDGVVIDKEVEPGAPKSVSGGRIALLRAPLEIEKTEWDVGVKLADPGQVGMLLSDESKIILDKMHRVVFSGANVVFCERGIDTLVRQYLSDKFILAAKWIGREDMNRLTKATGGTIVADVSDLSFSDLGTADLVEEEDFGEKRMLIVQGCKHPKTVTILVRGPSESVVKEAERSITQVLRSLKNLFMDPRVVPGGGAIEAELASRLREYATRLGGKARAATMTFADALDSVPVTLIRNSGGNVLDLLTSLRTRHRQGEHELGVDANSGNLANTSSEGVIEPLRQKAHMIKSACEVATTILSVDEVVVAEYRERDEKKREGEDEKSEDKPSVREALQSNISVARTLADLVRKSLGPNGMMKLTVDNIGDARATSDGATILEFIYAQHPVAKLLVSATESHSRSFGDGTKTLVVLVGELVSQAEILLSQGVQLPVIWRGYRTSADLAINELERLSHRLDLDDRAMLTNIVSSVMHESTAQIHAWNKGDAVIGNITRIILDAFSRIHESYSDHVASKFDAKRIKVIKKAGSGLFDSRLTDGYVVAKEVTSSDMPKRVEKARIAIVDYWLGITKQTLRRESKIQILDVKALRDYLGSAPKLSKEIADRVVSSGASVVFCSKVTDDLTKRFLAHAGIMVVEAVSSDDIEALANLTGGRRVSDPSGLSSDYLGEANLVEERDINGAKFIFVEGCPNRGYACVFIRGGTASVADDAERIIRKTIRTLVQLSKDPRAVPGGGLSELEAARELKRQARKTSGREQLAMLGFAVALEGIPKTLYENAGLDPLEELTRASRAPEEQTNPDSSGNPRIWDPYPQKKQVILNATGVANTILKLGHIVKCRRKPTKNEALTKS